MASGDDMLPAEISEGGPKVEVAVTKTALSYHAVKCLRPADAQALVKSTAASAIAAFRSGKAAGL